HNKASGYLEFENARVNWFLSLDYQDVPEMTRQKGLRTFRSLKIDGEEFEFSEGFTDLHTISYQEILNGKGFRLIEAAPSIQIVHQIRMLKP
ncbi:MAG TPA: oxidoreductase, partial [Bacteroidia bacterium]|nr:oxidoreductase [Bacteroidia bacterium]